MSVVPDGSVDWTTKALDLLGEAEADCPGRLRQAIKVIRGSVYPRRPSWQAMDKAAELLAQARHHVGDPWLRGRIEGHLEPSAGIMELFGPQGRVERGRRRPPRRHRGDQW